jgi:hypothetical protein
MVKDHKRSLTIAGHRTSLSRKPHNCQHRGRVGPEPRQKEPLQRYSRLVVQARKEQLGQIPQKLQTFAIRICPDIVIWRDSFPASRFRLAGKRARAQTAESGSLEPVLSLPVLLSASPARRASSHPPTACGKISIHACVDGAPGGLVLRLP